MTEPPHLFRPLTLRGQTPPNRNAVALTRQYGAVDGAAVRLFGQGKAPE